MDHVGWVTRSASRHQYGGPPPPRRRRGNRHGGGGRGPRLTSKGPRNVHEVRELDQRHSLNAVKQGGRCSSSPWWCVLRHALSVWSSMVADCRLVGGRSLRGIRRVGENGGVMSERQSADRQGNGSSGFPLLLPEFCARLSPPGPTRAWPYCVGSAANVEAAPASDALIRARQLGKQAPRAAQVSRVSDLLPGLSALQSRTPPLIPRSGWSREERSRRPLAAPPSTTSP